MPSLLSTDPLAAIEIALAELDQEEDRLKQRLAAVQRDRISMYAAKVAFTKFSSPSGAPAEEVIENEDDGERPDGEPVSRETEPELQTYDLTAKTASKREMGLKPQGRENLDLVRKHGPLTADALAKLRGGVTRNAAAVSLKILAQRGLLRTERQGRAALYTALSVAPVGKPKGGVNTVGVVRDWARKRGAGGPFKATDVAEATGLSRVETSKALYTLKQQGVLTGELQGTDRKAGALWRVAKPQGGPTNHPKQPAVERGFVGASRAPSAPVSGTGSQRKMSKEISDLVAPALSAGYTLHAAGSGHFKLLDPQGRVISTVPASPSDHRSLKNQKAHLKRCGVPV